jgi:hypothetical protein
MWFYLLTYALLAACLARSAGADLTKDDLVKLKDDLVKLFDVKLEHLFDVKLEHLFDVKLEPIQYQLDEIQQNQQQFQYQLDEMQQQLRLEHNFVPTRVQFLREISQKYESKNCNDVVGTSFRMTLDGYSTHVTVNHFNCTGPIEKEMWACPVADLAFSMTCPDLKSSVDGSVNAGMQEGDPVVAYGFSDLANYWAGNLGSPLVAAHQQHSEPWNGVAKIIEGEYTIIGDQRNGQSGGLCLNSVGAVGVVHAHNKDHRRLGYVIPMSVIQKCMRQAIRQGVINTAVSCGMDTPSKPPHLSIKTKNTLQEVDVYDGD